MRYVKQLSLDLPFLAGKGDPAEIEKKLVYLIEHKYMKSPSKKRGEKGEKVKVEE